MTIITFEGEKDTGMTPSSTVMTYRMYQEFEVLRLIRVLKVAIQKRRKVE